jgi:hypothetical protein
MKIIRVICLEFVISIAKCRLSTAEVVEYSTYVHVFKYRRFLRIRRTNSLPLMKDILQYIYSENQSGVRYFLTKSIGCFNSIRLICKLSLTKAKYWCVIFAIKSNINRIHLVLSQMNKNSIKHSDCFTSTFGYL